MYTHITGQIVRFRDLHFLYTVCVCVCIYIYIYILIPVLNLVIAF